MYAVLNNPFKYAVIGNQMCVYQQPDYAPGVYGYLYNYTAATDGSLAAPGWRVTYYSDWQYLITYLQNEYSYPYGDLSRNLHSCRLIDSSLGGGCSTDIHPRWDKYLKTGALHNQAFFDTFNFGILPNGIVGRAVEDTSVGYEAYFWCSDISTGSGAYVTTFYSEWNTTSLDFRIYGLSFTWANKYTIAAGIRLVRDVSGGESSLADGDSVGFYTANDGRLHATVKLGNRVWLAENLIDTKNVDGNDIPLITGNPNSYTYSIRKAPMDNSSYV